MNLNSVPVLQRHLSHVPLSHVGQPVARPVTHGGSRKSSRGWIEIGPGRSSVPGGGLFSALGRTKSTRRLRIEAISRLASPARAGAGNGLTRSEMRTAPSRGHAQHNNHGKGFAVPWPAPVLMTRLHHRRAGWCATEPAGKRGRASGPCRLQTRVCRHVRYAELLVPSVPIRPVPSPISHPTPPPVPLRPSCRLPCVVLSALAPLFLPPGSPRFFGINRIRAGEGTDLPHLVLRPSSLMYRGQIRMPAGSGACHPPVALAAPHSLALVRFRPSCAPTPTHAHADDQPPSLVGWCPSTTLWLLPSRPSSCAHNTPQRRSRPPTSASHLWAWA